MKELNCPSGGADAASAVSAAAVCSYRPNSFAANRARTRSQFARLANPTLRSSGTASSFAALSKRNGEMRVVFSCLAHRKTTRLNLNRLKAKPELLWLMKG